MQKRIGHIFGITTLLVGLLNHSPLQAIEPKAWELTRQAQLLEKQDQRAAAEEAYRKSIALDPYDQMNFIQLGALLSRQGRVNEAISLYRKAAELDAQDPMIYYTIGALYEQTGDYPRAEEAYQRSLKRTPDYPYGLLNLARTQTQQGHYPEALQNYLSFLTTYPDHFQARRYVAHLYRATRQESKAVEAYQWIKAHYPDRFTDHLDLARALTRSEAPEKALEELKTALAKEGNKAEILDEMGHAHRALGQNAQALVQYEAAYQLQPTTVERALWIAQLASQLEQPEKAIPYYQRYLEKYPQQNPIRHELAQAHLAAKQYPEAVQTLSQVVETVTEPQEKYALKKELAYALQMKGDIPQAIEYYEALLHSPPGQTDDLLKTNLAIAYHQAHQYEKAAQLYDGLVKRDESPTSNLLNDYLNVLQALAQQQTETQNWEGALAWYEKALSLPIKEKQTLWMAVGQVYEKKGDLAQAINFYEQVVDKVPNHAEAWTALAQGYQTLKQPDKAIKAYEKALELNPAGGLHYNLAVLYYDQQNWPQATQEYQKALQIDPTLADAHYGLALVLEQQQQWVPAIGHYETYVTQGQGTYLQDAQQRLGQLKKQLPAQ